MRCAVVLVLGFLTVAVTATSESPASLAQEHVKQACAVVWANAAPQQIQRCTERAMAALGADELLRYNELTRMLIDSDRELESCKADLVELRNEVKSTKVSRKH